MYGSPELELSSIDTKTAKRNLTYISSTDNLDRSLMNGDVINISSVAGISPKSIQVSGEIKNPGEYSIQPGDTIRDIILRSGGYTDQSFFQGAVFLR